MVERKIARLKLTQAEVEAYRPPTGFDVVWLEWDVEHGEVVAEFIVSDMQLDPLLRKTAKDITHELGTTFRHRLLDTDMPTYTSDALAKRNPFRLQMLLDHPLLKSEDATIDMRRAADTATDVHEVELTGEQFNNIQRIKKNIKLEPKEVRQRTIKTIEDKEKGTKDDWNEEIYVMDFGEVDSG